MADRRTTTIRFRVTALATAVTTVVLAVTAVGVVISQRRAMIEALDEALEVEADQLMQALDDLPVVLAPAVDDDGVAQVVIGEQVVAASRGVSTSRPLTAVDGLRLMSVRAGDATVTVGAPTEDIDEAMSRLATSLAIAFIAVVGVLAVLVWVLVGRTLAPVEAIRAEVAAIGAADLGRRVPEPASDDEIGRLARTMNEMLERLEDAARRQQHFVADASHELRSPLARVRAELEVDLSRPDDADLAATHRSVLATTSELERLVDDLLLVARADAGMAAGERRAVDLDDLVLRHARRVRERGTVAVDASGVSAAQVVGDAGQLDRAIGNVVDNAARHAAALVVLTLAEADTEAVLTVTDDGPGIPIEHHDAVFERFTRLDAARTPGSGGAGLGLAIARDIVVRHHGTITIDGRHTTGARFVIRLPLDVR